MKTLSQPILFPSFAGSFGKAELAHNREFSVYSAQMDAALYNKISDIAPWVKEGVVVDAGFGTGELARYIALQHPASQIIGIDCSEHFLTNAMRHLANIANVRLVQGNIIDKHLATDSVDTIIFSTVLHEVYSYTGYDITAVEKALTSALDELKPDGRIIIRDGIMPEKKTAYLLLKNNNGSQNITEHPKCLSTEAMFLRFIQEFKNGTGAPHRAMKNTGIIPPRGFGERLYCTSSHTAYEFLSKKDYRDNWHIEINEQFGYLTLKQYETLLEKLGYHIVSSRGFQNPWIVENRWEQDCILMEKTKNGFAQAPWPNTNAVIVAEKPLKKTS